MTLESTTIVILDTLERIGETFDGVEGKRLTYENLTKEVDIYPFPGLRPVRRYSA